MDKIFAEMFAKQPDEIIGGDYFYHIPWLENIFVEAVEHKGLWPYQWLKGESNPFFYDPMADVLKGANKDSEFEEMIGKIAHENKPFMDIASSESMGLASYIVKLNPQIPCLVTDIDAHQMMTLRSCVDEHLTGYNINLASFDNNHIPMKDNSLDYITSNNGIASSGGKPDVSKKANIYQFSTGKEKVIAEVYRVLKPGGCYVAIESNRECDFDLRKIYDYHAEHGSLFGLYSYDEIQAVCGLLIEEPWRDKFTSAGFEIEIEKKHCRSYSLWEVMNFLHYFTRYHEIHHWEKENWEQQRREENFTWNFDKNELGNIGMDLYDVDIFYVLRKPI